MALGGWGYSGIGVLPQALGFFTLFDLLKMWPTLMLGVSHFWRVRQTRAVALFCLAFLPLSRDRGDRSSFWLLRVFQALSPGIFPRS